MTKPSLYIVKILAGLVLLSGLACLPLVANQLTLTPDMRNLIVGLLLSLFLLIYPVVFYFHRRCDELLQQIHLRACLFALCGSVIAFLMIGVLQQMELITHFSFLYAVVLLIAFWGLGLMLADREHH